MKVVALLLLLAISGCRGWTSSEPPIHPNPNMDTQIKYKPYRGSDFFADQRDMRPRVEGTIARGDLASIDEPHLTYKIMQRGRERFNIYCAPCHSAYGDGNGIVGRRLPIRPTTFHNDYMRAQTREHYVDVITNGIRTMPAYKHQIPMHDRWAIAAYIQALQELDAYKQKVSP